MTTNGFPTSVLPPFPVTNHNHKTFLPSGAEFEFIMEEEDMDMNMNMNTNTNSQEQLNSQVQTQWQQHQYQNHPRPFQYQQQQQQQQSDVFRTAHESNYYSATSESSHSIQINDTSSGSGYSHQHQTTQSAPLHSNLQITSVSSSGSSNKRSFSCFHDNDDDSLMNDGSDNHNSTSIRSEYMSDMNEQCIKKLRIDEHQQSLHNKRNHEQCYNKIPVPVPVAQNSWTVSTSTSTLSSASGSTPTPASSSNSMTSNSSIMPQYHGHALTPLPTHTATVRSSGSLLSMDHNTNGKRNMNNMSTVSIDDLGNSLSIDGTTCTTASTERQGYGSTNMTMNHVLGSLHLERERRMRLMGGACKGGEGVNQWVANAQLHSVNNATSTGVNVPVDHSSSGRAIQDAQRSCSLQSASANRNTKTSTNKRGCIPRTVRLQSHSNLG